MGIKLLFVFSLSLIGLMVGGLNDLHGANEYKVLAIDYYVNQKVEIDGDGSKAQPFRSLESMQQTLAKTLANDRPPQDGITVHLESGSYFLKDSLVFDYKHSVAGYSQLTIKGSKEGETVFQMGQTLKAEHLTPIVEKETLSRLRTQAQGKVKQVSLAVIGLSVARPPEIYPDLDGGLPELYFNGRQLPLSRYPNEGSMTMGELIDPGVWWGPDRKPGSYKFKDDRHKAWGKAIESGLWFNGFWRIPWQSHTVRVASIDPESRIVTHAVSVGEGASTGPFAGIGSKYTRPKGSGKEPYVALNLLEEIDQPGEWSIDIKKQVLYLWPPEMDGDIIICNNKKPLLILAGTSHIQLKNITFTGSRENGVEIVGGVGNELSNCTFKNLGGWGSIIRGGYRNGVSNSIFHDLGKGGVELSGGDPITLTHCYNFCKKSEFYALNQIQTTWAPAIQIGRGQMSGSSTGLREAVGIIAEGNKIHDLPHSAILYGGNFNRIFGNEIYNIAKVTHDVGFIYTRHDWTSRGNIIAENLLYGSPNANGIYIDDGDSGDIVLKNTIIGANYGIVFGGGRDNRAEHNIIKQCKVGFFMDDRGVKRQYNAESEGKMSEMAIVPKGDSVWKEKFPELFTLLEDHPEWPLGNIFKNNSFVGCEKNIDFIIDTVKDSQHIKSRVEIKDNTIE